MTSKYLGVLSSVLAFVLIPTSVNALNNGVAKLPGMCPEFSLGGPKVSRVKYIFLTFITNTFWGDCCLMCN